MLVAQLCLTLCDPMNGSCQAPLTPRMVAARLLCPVGFPKQEYWSGLPCPSPGDLPNPGIQHTSPASQVGSLTLSHQGSLLLKNSPRDCGPNTVQFAVIHGRLFCPPPLQEAFPNTSNQMWSLPPNPYLYTHFSCWLPGPCLGLSHHDLLFTLPGREDLCPGKKEGPSCRQ